MARGWCSPGTQGRRHGSQLAMHSWRPTGALPWFRFKKRISSLRLVQRTPDYGDHGAHPFCAFPWQAGSAGERGNEWSTMTQGSTLGFLGFGGRARLTSRRLARVSPLVAGRPLSRPRKDIASRTGRDPLLPFWGDGGEEGGPFKVVGVVGDVTIAASCSMTKLDRHPTSTSRPRQRQPP